MEGKRISHFDFTFWVILFFFHNSFLTVVTAGGDSGKFLSEIDTVVIFYLVLTLKKKNNNNWHHPIFYLSLFHCSSFPLETNLFWENESTKFPSGITLLYLIWAVDNLFGSFLSQTSWVQHRLHTWTLKAPSFSYKSWMPCFRRVTCIWWLFKGDVQQGTCLIV